MPQLGVLVVNIQQEVRLIDKLARVDLQCFGFDGGNAFFVTQTPNADASPLVPSADKVRLRREFNPQDAARIDPEFDFPILNLVDTAVANISNAQ